MKKFFLVIGLMFTAYATAQPVPLQHGSAPSSARIPPIGQMNAMPQLKCDPKAALRHEVRVRHIAVTAFPKDTPAGRKATPEELRAAHAKLQDLKII